MANQLPRDVAQKVLDKLASDDDFRSLFTQNPRAALQQVGYETPEADRDVAGRDPILPLYQLRGGLASKEQIKANSDRLMRMHAQYEAGDAKAAIFAPFDMCAD